MPKPTFESLHALSGSFLIRRFNEEAFSSPYHYHPELELTLILKGQGKRYVGNSMLPYTPGDLVMLGSDLPHCWKSENVVKGKKNASSLVLQFREDCFGTGFFQKNEMSFINGLLQKSNAGIQFTGATATEAAAQLQQVDKEKHLFKKMIRFLELLYFLAGSEEYVMLNKEHMSLPRSSAESLRINKVMAFIVEHFRESITLEQIASLAGMTTAAFCKFFKRTTKKTFIEMIIEYRLNYALQQLIHTDLPVSEISFSSGFGDVSHFYKTFRQRKHISPLQYRNRFRKNLTH